MVALERIEKERMEEEREAMKSNKKNIICNILLANFYVVLILSFKKIDRNSLYFLYQRKRCFLSHKMRVN